MMKKLMLTFILLASCTTFACASTVTTIVTKTTVKERPTINRKFLVRKTVAKLRPVKIVRKSIKCGIHGCSK
jgi:hypothetical protein